MSVNCLLGGLLRFSVLTLCILPHVLVFKAVLQNHSAEIRYELVLFGKAKF